MNHCELEELLVFANDDVCVVAADKVELATETGADAVLFGEPVHVLQRVAPECHFDISGEYMRLCIRGRDGAVNSFATRLDEARKVHFYRRLLAQTALGVLGTEVVCTRLIEGAITTKLLTMHTLVAAIFPDASEQELACMTQTATAEMFVRKVTIPQLTKLIEMQLSNAVDLSFEVELIHGRYFCTAFLACNGRQFETHIYAPTVTIAHSVVLVHLLTNVLKLPSQ